MPLNKKNYYTMGNPHTPGNKRLLVTELAS